MLPDYQKEPMTLEVRGKIYPLTKIQSKLSPGGDTYYFETIDDSLNEESRKKSIRQDFI